ncbi:hypothetical protein G9A89_007443 [Geosiphon pyriformis]|nr:hypothetical protein G9A89_007443 [Geosiphon pyriformis]
MFTSELGLAKATKKAADVKILVNTNLKKSFRHLDQTVVLKKISVNISAKTVCAALSDFEIKPAPLATDSIEVRFTSLECSLVSLIKQIGELAKRLDLLMPAISQSSPECQLPMTLPLQNYVNNIVIKKGSDKATSGKTAVILGLSASSETAKFEAMLENFSALVLSLSAHFDDITSNYLGFQIK